MSALNRKTAWLRRCVITLGVALGPSLSLAGTASFSIPLEAVTISLGGEFSSTDGILLPTTGRTTFTFNFVMPLDYVSDQPVKVVLYLRAPGTPSPCTARFFPERLQRRRIGLPLFDNPSGLSAGNPSVRFPDNAIRGKLVTVKPGTVVPGQRRGDAFVVGISRDADDASDNCGIIFVMAIDVRYPTP
jgi:hypothetical protein